MFFYQHNMTLNHPNTCIVYTLAFYRYMYEIDNVI